MAAREESPTVHARALRPPTDPSRLVVVITRPPAPTEIEQLCERLRVLLEYCDAELVVCDVGALVHPDAVMVDALARLQLTARRCGYQIRLYGACGELQELFALMGLSDLFPSCADLPLEPRGQAEEGEQARGVEEERDPGDPAG